MAKTKSLSAKQVLADIKAGMSDDELMQKYELSEKTMDRVFGKLLSAGLLTMDQLDERIRDQSLPLAKISDERTKSADTEEEGSTQSQSVFSPKDQSFDLLNEAKEFTKYLVVAVLPLFG